MEQNPPKLSELKYKSYFLLLNMIIDLVQPFSKVDLALASLYSSKLPVATLLAPPFPKVDFQKVDSKIAIGLLEYLM